MVVFLLILVGICLLDEDELELLFEHALKPRIAKAAAPVSTNFL